MASQDIQDIYLANPTTTVLNDTLLYLGVSPYGALNDSAIKIQDIFPSSATANAITRYNGTSGKKIQNSGATVDDNALLTTVTTKVSTVSSSTLGGYFIGVDRYISDYGSSPGFNLFVGKSVGNTTLTTVSSLSNCGVGSFMMTGLTTGASNTAVGVSTSTSITSSSFNTAIGNASLTQLTTGSGQNTAVGCSSLINLGTGSNNSCLGYNSGSNYNTTESNNICIGNTGTAADSGVIRIGTSGTHTSAYISGINGVSVSNELFVVMNSSTAQLGTDIGVNMSTATTFNGTTGTLALADAKYFQICSNAATQTLTVPTNASVAFPINTEIVFFQQGAGQVVFAAAGGVTIQSASGNLKIASQYSTATLKKIGTDTWALFGGLSA